VILTKQKRKEKENCPTLVSSTFGRPIMFEKFFTHRTRNNFEAFHGIEGPSLKLQFGTRM